MMTPQKRVQETIVAGTISRRQAIGRLALGAVAAPALAFSTSFGSLFMGGIAAAHPRPAPVDTDVKGFAPATVMEPAQLAELLSQSGEKPAVLCVGFSFLYDTAHVPGAILVGPGREAAGLALLEKWAQDAPRNKNVVVYCGCCPWEKCPNIRPAYDSLKKMGFTRLKVLRIDDDFAKNWVAKGLPIEKK